MSKAALMARSISIDSTWVKSRLEIRYAPSNPMMSLMLSLRSTASGKYNALPAPAGSQPPGADFISCGQCLLTAVQNKRPAPPRAFTLTLGPAFVPSGNHAVRCMMIRLLSATLLSSDASEAGMLRQGRSGWIRGW